VLVVSEIVFAVVAVVVEGKIEPVVLFVVALFFLTVY
jgi:hypothetical protein